MSAWRSLRILAVLCATVVLIYNAVLANVYRHAGIDQTRVTDVIIVLGASQWDGRPSPVFQARLDRAYDLYRAGYAPYIIVTGGIGELDTYSDSEVGKKYLQGRGVHEGAIYAEEVSRTTFQNLNEAARIMHEEGYASALLVSHDFHMMRAKKMSRDLGFITFAAPVVSQSATQQFKYSVREVWMYALYRVFGV